MNEHRDIALDRNIAAIERITEQARDAYMAAVRATRYGSTPAVRTAALQRARQLRPLVHA